MDFYHALNRGVDKRTIFQDSQDYARFIHDMYEFNDIKPASNTYRSSTSSQKMFDIVSRTSDRIEIVNIHGWCLMDNHYHLLLSERTVGGIPDFLRKMNVGYAKYFNEKYKRVGTLFQGRTKRVHIDNDAYFLHILNYIHFNPLDFTPQLKDWRSRKILNSGEALLHLKNYRWSSYLDYIGTKNFPSILTTEFFQDVFNNDYAGQVEKYLKDISIHELQGMTLE